MSVQKSPNRKQEDQRGLVSRGRMYALRDMSIRKVLESASHKGKVQYFSKEH